MNERDKSIERRCGVMDLIYDEKTGTWGAKEEPLSTIEIQTEEDYEFLKKAIKFYKEYLKCGATNEAN